MKGSQAPAVQQAAPAEDGGQDGTKATNSKRSSKKGATLVGKQQQQQVQQQEELPTKDQLAQLGKEVEEYVHDAVPNIYQIVSELRAGKGADLVFPCPVGPGLASEDDGTGSFDQEIPSLSSKKAFEDALHKIPRYMQTSLQKAASKLLDDPSPGGPMRWGQALGKSMSAYLARGLPKKQSVEEARRHRLQLANMCCSTLKQLKGNGIS